MTESNRYPAHDLSTMVERLAPSASAKYHALTGRLDEVHALLKLCLDQEKDLDTRRNVCARALHSSALPESDAANKRLREQLAQLDREHEVLERKRSRLNSARGNLDQTLSHLRNALPGCYGSPAAEPIVAEPREGETISDAILHVRGEIGGKQSELVAIKSAPWPAAEQRAWLHQQIAQLQKDGPRLIVGQDGRPEIFSPDVSQFAPPGATFVAPSGSALRLLASLFPDQLFACLEQQIVDAPHAIAFADRPQRIREIEQQILRLEFAEESLIEQALESGIEVHRRPQASVYAILGLHSPIFGPRQPVVEEQQLEVAAAAA
jgi:hypothetical protein